MSYEVTLDELTERLWFHVNRSNQRVLARKIGISAAYLNDILHGKREPGPHTLKFLGVEKKVSYIANRR